MKFDFKDMYRFLLSHSFPGLILFIEIVIYLNTTSHPGIIAYLENRSAVILILGVYVFSTLFGIILDAIQHLLISDLWNIFVKKKDEHNKFIALRNKYSRE